MCIFRPQSPSCRRKVGNKLFNPYNTLMKKTYLLLSFLILGMYLMAQPVARNYVMLEIGTGCWCYYCPGAAMGADDLIANGDPVAVCENHNGDPFATTDSDARNSYYGITGYPTAWFDGSYDSHVGGDHTQSLYSTYKPKVDARIVMDSDLTLDIFGTNDGDDYDITLRIQDVNSYSGTNLWLRFALTESEIDYVWQGMDEVNFVNRLMVPDHNGTDLSAYDLSSLTDIVISFTFDNTWVSDHCELVAFIQDDDTQEVLQSQKVALDDLIPPLMASFSASDTITCYGSAIDFTDQSMGTGITDWDWTFEGGTPGTSTDQNPTITYNTPGVYWVELTVTDDVGSDTKREEAYIHVYETPAQAETPDGETTTCTDMFYDYTISEIPYTQEYEWELDPPDAGTLIVSDNEAAFEAADDWTGEFTLKVRATNLCGDGDWSDELEATLYQAPNEYTLQGGGSYCDGGDGAEVTLSGSDVDVQYELYLDGVSTGMIIDGNGYELSFGFQTSEGYYSAVAFNDNCTLDMVNQIGVEIIYPPEAPAQPNGSEAICNDTPTEYETDGLEGVDTYGWEIYPEDAAALVENDLEVTVQWNADFSGVAELAVYGINECGAGVSSEYLIIDVDDIPEPAVEGEELVCDDQVEVYTTLETEGNTYTWDVTGGTITDGEGTSTVTIQWGEAGTGTINLEEETPNGCYAASEEFLVTIDDCTGIGEHETVTVSLNPNPAKDFVVIQSENTLQSIQIMSLTGEEVAEHMVNDNTVHIKTSAFSPGLYLVRIETDKGIISKRLIIK
jgi:PKD repeat protein